MQRWMFNKSQRGSQLADKRQTGRSLPSILNQHLRGWCSDVSSPKAIEYGGLTNKPGLHRLNRACRDC